MPFGQPPRPFGAQPPGAGQNQSSQPEQRSDMAQNPFGRGFYQQPPVHTTQENPFDKADPQPRESDNPFAKAQRNPFGDGPTVTPTDLENPFEDRGPNPFIEEKPKSTDKQPNPFGEGPDIDPSELENPFEDRGPNPFLEEKRKSTDKQRNPFGDGPTVTPTDLENPFEDRGPNPFADEPTVEKESISDAVKNTMSADVGDAVADNKFTELRDPYKEAAAAAEKDTSGPEMG